MTWFSLNLRPGSNFILPFQDSQKSATEPTCNSLDPGIRSHMISRLCQTLTFDLACPLSNLGHSIVRAISAKLDIGIPLRVPSCPCWTLIFDRAVSAILDTDIQSFVSCRPSQTLTFGRVCHLDHVRHWHSIASALSAMLDTDIRLCVPSWPCQTLAFGHKSPFSLVRHRLPIARALTAFANSHTWPKLRRALPFKFLGLHCT